MWDLIARAIVLLVTLPIHECAHAYTAVRLGDDTPIRQGRLTLNPFRHLDVFGSMALLIIGFGWAKPVMVDPRNFSHPRRDMALTSLAGPLANIAMAFAAMMPLKILFYTMYAGGNVTGAVLEMLRLVILINVRLAVFNLLPCPPLDGSKILAAFLPERAYFFLLKYERFVMFALILLLWFNYLDGPIGALSNAVWGFLDLLTRPIDLLLAPGFIAR